MLIVQDQVWNRVTVNRAEKKATRYYMDEFHLLLKEEQTAAYSVEIWKRFRKWGGIPTAITQNVKDLLASREVENSLSVSDIVVLHRDGRDAAHYVDSIGYREVPEFFKEQGRQLTPDELETGETVKTPRGTFYVTAMSREQMEAAGYGLHHQSEDGKYLIMGNGTRAFAVPVQPENYLKAAEQTTEQNYNMIDGQINNTPTTAELEAKVKAGETISLVDLAEAVKADKERSKTVKTEKKPSIRAQLRADKEKNAQKKAAKSKNHELEV